MDFKPTYENGQKVQATHSYAHILVAGEVYTVVYTTPPIQVGAFRFPEYVTVEDAQGLDQGQWYPWRFRAV